MVLGVFKKFLKGKPDDRDDLYSHLVDLSKSDLFKRPGGYNFNDCVSLVGDSFAKEPVFYIVSGLEVCEAVGGSRAGETVLVLNIKNFHDARGCASDMYNFMLLYKSIRPKITSKMALAIDDHANVFEIENDRSFIVGIHDSADKKTMCVAMSGKKMPGGYMKMGQIH